MLIHKPSRHADLLRPIAWGIALLYLLDRSLRLLTLRNFFRRKAPPAPELWPAVDLICPLTRTPNNLRQALTARARLTYPGQQRCLLVCDEHDGSMQELCREVIAAHPTWRAEILSVASDGGAVASKVAKLRAALAHAQGEVLCFLDDDVTLRPDGLQVLVRHTLGPEVGAAFGLACYTAWGTLAESLMSGFVNSNALPGYVSLAYLVEPFTITGHCFAMRRTVFEQVGGLAGMAGRFDDDHELARRVRGHGLRNVQSPLIYDVENRLATLRDYHEQLRRWMLMPRLAMLPGLGRRERVAMLVSGSGALLPPALLLIALASRRPATLSALALSLAAFAGSSALIERAYLGRTMPARRLPLLPALACLTPIHVALAAVGGNTISWRGQRLRIERGGRFTVVGPDR